MYDMCMSEDHGITLVETVSQFLDVAADKGVDLRTVCNWRVEFDLRKTKCTFTPCHMFILFIIQHH